MPFRIGRLGVVGEADVLEPDLALADHERRRARPVDDLGGDLEQVEHRLDIDQPLLDLAIDHADEIERHGELHQQRIDQDEIADRLLARACTPAPTCTMQMVMPTVKMTPGRC